MEEPEKNEGDKLVNEIFTPTQIANTSLIVCLYFSICSMLVGNKQAKESEKETLGSCVFDSLGDITLTANNDPSVISACSIDNIK